MQIAPRVPLVQFTQGNHADMAVAVGIGCAVRGAVDEAVGGGAFLAVDDFDFSCDGLMPVEV